MIDKQHTVQVIEFVLVADGVQALDFLLDPLALAVQIGDADPSRAFDLVEVFRNGETAFFVAEGLIRGPILTYT